MTASALEVWVIRSEHKLILFLVRKGFRCILEPIQKTQDRGYAVLGQHISGHPKRFDQDLVFAPLSWSLPCVGTIQAFWVQPDLHRFFSAISYRRHRHRLKLYSRTEESGSKWCSIKHVARYELYIVVMSFKLD